MNIDPHERETAVLYEQASNVITASIIESYAQINKNTNNRTFNARVSVVNETR